jgi:hypothetical protein
VVQFSPDPVTGVWGMSDWANIAPGTTLNGFYYMMTLTGRVEPGQGYVLYTCNQYNVYRYVVSTDTSTIVASAVAPAYFRGVVLPPTSDGAWLPASPSTTPTQTRSSTNTPTSSRTATQTPSATSTFATLTMTPSASHTPSNLPTPSQAPGECASILAANPLLPQLMGTLNGTSGTIYASSVGMSAGFSTGPGCPWYIWGGGDTGCVAHRPLSGSC